MVKPRNLSPERARGRAGLLTVATLGAAGAALLSLFAVTEATVAADGTLTEPFWALALGTLSLTAACLVALGLLFLSVRRRIRGGDLSEAAASLDRLVESSKVAKQNRERNK